MKNSMISVFVIALITVTALVSCNTDNKNVIDDKHESAVSAVSRIQDVSAVEKSDSDITDVSESSDVSRTCAEKIDAAVYGSTQYEGGKYLVCITRRTPEGAEFFRGDLEKLRGICSADVAGFIGEIGVSQSDVYYSGIYTGTVIAYLTGPEMDSIAERDDVFGISAWTNAEETVYDAYGNEVYHVIPARIIDDPASKIRPDVFESPQDENGRFRVVISRFPPDDALKAIGQVELLLSVYDKSNTAFLKSHSDLFSSENTGVFGRNSIVTFLTAAQIEMVSLIPEVFEIKYLSHENPTEEEIPVEDVMVGDTDG